MAGRPKVKADIALLQSRLLEVEQLLSEGVTQSEVMRRLGIGRRAWYDWIGTPEGSEVTTRARARAATALAEETLQIADTTTPEEERVARLRIDTRRWVAKAWAPALYGDRVMADVRVQDVTALHVAQLRGFARPEGNSVGNSRDAIDVTPVTSTTYDHDTADGASADGDDSA